MPLKGELYIAGPFGEEQVERVKESFRRLLNQEVAFDVRRDERLIGGFRAMVDGRVYDSSVQTRIKDIERYLFERE